MPRSIWNGALSFGLVNVPVQLFSATQQKDVRFHQIQAGTGQRIRYRRVAEKSGEEVDYEDIVKGYELDKGAYVIVTPDELEAVAPGRSRTIDIEDFIDLDEIDPIHFEKTYYLAPRPETGAERAYALLRTAMERANKVAVGRFVMRTKQSLGAIRPSGRMLLLETMFFPDEVRAREEIDTVPGDVELPDRELKMAEQLIDSLTVTWEPDRYQDTYRQRVLDLIQRKAEGEEVVTDRPEPEDSGIGDLMAALEASLADARGGRREPRRESGGRSDGLGDMTRDELYERAKEEDISGRSKMTRDELMDALRQAAS